MAKNIPAPEPETTSAYLVLENKKRATLHIYLETRETIVDGPAWEYIFKCLETGVERRWGVIDRLTFKDMDGN